MAGIATVTTGHPFDTVKVKFQKYYTEAGGVKYKNGLHCATRILQMEEVEGLYLSVTSSFIGIAFESSLSFGIYSQTNRFLQGEVDVGKPQHHAIVSSADFGGAIISFILCPSELVKCRMQVQGTDFIVPKCTRFSGPLECALKTVKREGACFEEASPPYCENPWAMLSSLLLMSVHDFHASTTERCFI